MLPRNRVKGQWWIAPTLKRNNSHLFVVIYNSKHKLLIFSRIITATFHNLKVSFSFWNVNYGTENTVIPNSMFS